jgi:predicted 2-oxoglutarate/Fe(II)-dependent dioxygenase YbiX
MKLRDNVLIQRNAINPEEIEFLIDHVKQAQMMDSLVSSFDDGTQGDVVEWVVNREIRDTQEVQLPRAIAEKLSCIDAASVLAFINPFYNVEVRYTEPSQILHYGIGGHYIPHVDSETPYKDDMGLDMWEKTLDRDLSAIYFLNDDFAGGELVFPALDLVVKPEAGTLVCFPSDHNYVHGVNPVTAGHRYTIVTWMRIKGMPTVDEINQMAMEEYNRMWPKQIEQPSRLKKGGMR